MSDDNNSKVSWVAGISVVTLFVEDLPLTRQFYSDVFEVPAIFEDPNSVVFNFGNIIINLLDVRAAEELANPAKVADCESGSRHVFTIHVDNVDEKCRELVSRGVKILSGPIDRPWGIRTASFQDPAGHIWEIAKQVSH